MRVYFNPDVVAAYGDMADTPEFKVGFMDFYLGVLNNSVPDLLRDEKSAIAWRSGWHAAQACAESFLKNIQKDC